MKKTLYLILALLLAFTLAACGGGEGEDGAEHNSNVVDESAPEYEVADSGRDDIGGRMVRAVYKVIVDAGVTEGQMRAAANELIEERTAEQEICALKAEFYSSQSQVDDESIDMGTVIWAPEGNWDAYMTIFPGNYTKHEMVFEAP